MSVTPSRVLQHLGRGINFGNALDAARGGPEFAMRERYFEDVRAAGFTTLRLPVRWSAHADPSPPYLIRDAFFGRVDSALRQALEHDLSVVVNVHHYRELNDAPDAHRARFLALWSQIAAHYASWPAKLYFELLNEPRGQMTSAVWNELVPIALAAIREHDPERINIVGPSPMNEIDALPQLVLPADDRLVVTIHYYTPFEFTHQGAPWVVGADRWLGRSWSEEAGRRRVRDDLGRASAWARTQGHALFIGEFGTYERADMQSRRQWTRCVRLEAEALGLSWSYWDFGTDFGAFDPHRGAWREPLRDALLGRARGDTTV